MFTSENLGKSPRSDVHQSLEVEAIADEIRIPECVEEIRIELGLCIAGF